MNKSSSFVARLSSFLALSLSGLTSASAQVGGGYTQAGPVGEYFANTSLSGSPAFVRREVRLDFDWGTVQPVGGSIAEPYKSFPTDNFSVRYTGELIAAFSETYTFEVTANDGVRVYLRPVGSGTWTTLVDQWSTPGTYTATQALTAAAKYELRVEYRDLTGAAQLKLSWSSPSTPKEVIDPVTQLGFNNDGSRTQTYADIVKCARNSWDGVDGNPAPTLDANGWPMSNCGYVFQESLQQGLGIDPLMRGKISFSLKGRADVSITGNVDGATLTSSYNAATNTTSGSFCGKDVRVNASYIRFRNTDRDGQTPVRNNGITDLKLMRPLAPDSATSYDPDVLFNSNMRTAMSDFFTALRVQLNNANQERFWSERTPPTYFNQNGGRRLPNVYVPNYGKTYPNGPSWEHKIMLCNETGRDFYLNIPVMADGWSGSDTASYVYKLAQLVRFGSDASGNPYSAPTANPVYPPLNPNLRVYVEVTNEIWNFFSDDFRQYHDIAGMIKADADAALGVGSSDPLARPQDFAIYNYDGQATTKDGNGNYNATGTWRFRKHLLRAMQASDIFRAVWGDANMMTRVRPLYEWQYADDNSTASGPLKFADDWFNNGNGNANVATPRPVSYFLFGGGGASYYGAKNPYGVTSQLMNSDFDAVTLSNGYTQAPTGHTWSFSGTAGIARDAGAGDDIPAPFNGSQMGYLDGAGSMTINVTVPASQTSNIYAIVFKSVQRVKTNAPLDTNGNPIPDAQQVKLFINGTASNSRSYNQNGQYFTPTKWNSQYPWEASVVFWTRGTAYYSSNTFTAAPGATVTVRLDGLAAAGNIAFIEDVRLASVDQMYADGFPGGGEALGQPAGSGYQNGLNVQGSWALAYGLKYVTYEGGWSLGGDTGGSPMQNAAKYGDSRTATVNVTALGMFHKAGGLLNTLGTYAQWPTWSDFYAQEGLLNMAANPLSQGQVTSLSSLPPTPTNGVNAPAYLAFNNLALARGNSSATLNALGWMSWNVIVPQSGTYVLAATTTGAGTVRLLVDDATVVATGAAGGTVSGSVYLSKGIHGVKLRNANTSSSLGLTQVTIAASGAPAAPSITSVADGNLSLTINWGTVSGATGYRVRYGTSPGVYPNSIDVGATNTYNMSGLTHNQAYYIAVGAYNASGEGLPSAERAAVAIADGQAGTLAAWDLLAANSVDGSLATVAATAASGRVSTGLLSRGASYTGGTIQSYAGPGAFNCKTSTATADLAAAKSAGAYFQWSVAPTYGYRFSLSTLNLAAYRQSGTVSVALEVSADAFATAGQLVGTQTISSSGWVGQVFAYDLSGISLVQNTTQTITFRAYYISVGFIDRGIGQVTGNNNDLEIVGSLTQITGLPPGAPTGFVATPGDSQIALAWNATSGATSYALKRASVSGGPYTTIAGSLTGTSFVNTGLSNGVTYHYVVSATNVNGEGANSAQVSAAPAFPAGRYRVNFQTTAAVVPDGYVPDSGATYGARFGLNYGWSSDRSSGSRERNLNADQRLDTLVTMGTATWELAVPNGRYKFTAVFGDTQYIDQVNTVSVEGTTYTDPDGQDNFDTYTGIVTVSDGRLSIVVTGNGANAKICYLDLDANTIPAITTSSLSDATVGTAYSQQLQASGGEGTLQWSVNAGSLPPGLNLSASGLISGTPTTGSPVQAPSQTGP